MKKTGRQIITFDWAIKTILRDKANFDVLEGFLTTLFGRPVVILDLLESESNRVVDRKVTRGLTPKPVVPGSAWSAVEVTRSVGPPG